ncbi:hypothetical protein [Chondromyces apiculatus]|uniref:hypothetical protein n=1 Tax=Chondromyces apiculatus TaxID=51 RepID=UPI0018CC1849|nr:hypothetical protein [Chondromyces apiculatus]
MTARRAATHPGHQAWVGIDSLEKPTRVYLNTADESLLGRMRVRFFEIAEELLGKGYDIHEEELKAVQLYVVSGSQELKALLQRFQVDPGTLNYKSVTEYPL